MGQTNTDKLLRVSEVAELLAIKESTIRAWLLARRISCVRVGRRAVRIPASEVDRILVQGTIPAKEERNGRP
jgi:excisionase family DNA binding protein